MPLIHKQAAQRYQSWIAIGGAAVGAIGSAYAANKNAKSQKEAAALQAGQSATAKEPWAAAAPWLKENVGAGQELQKQYAAQPFSAAQTAAYGNQAAQGDYMRSLVPSLLTQMQGQQVGFDRNDPQARQSAFQWGVQGDAADAGANLGMGPTSSMVTAQATDAAGAQAKRDAVAAAAAAANAPPPAAAPEAAKEGFMDKLQNFQKKVDPLGAATTGFLKKLF